MTTATVDDRKRVRLPGAKPGQVLAVEQNADGVITLTPMKKAETGPPKARLVKRGGRTYLSTGSGQKMNEQVLKELLAEFP